MRRLFLATVATSALAAFFGCNSSAPTSCTTGADKEAIYVRPFDPNDDSPRRPATEPMEGYVLIAPLRSRESYLLNASKQVVHRWTSDYPPANSAYLLENGDLIRGARDPRFDAFSGGGIGGIIERFSWAGELLWRFRYASEDHCAHHDIEPLPNGNVLMIAWERKSKAQAISQGRDPALLKSDLWPDHVIEIQPDGPLNGRIVWEWHMWDHLVQDFDDEKPNFGLIYAHPELIDLNYTGSNPPSTPEDLRKLRALGYTGGSADSRLRGGSDWLHTNAIDYNPELDQIALCARNFNEVWIIDHSTTTSEAASHQGGNSGKGGDLLYRWGNPWSYKSGTIESRRLVNPHDVRWIHPGNPGAGHITVFNNGRGRDYSSVVEIETPIDNNGKYRLNDDGQFGPYELTWEYTAQKKQDFHSPHISGAMRLPNGNSFICEGMTGRIFEVNSEGKTLWEYVNTFGRELDHDGRENFVEHEARKIFAAKNDAERSFMEKNRLFRATKYSADYAAFAGKTLVPLAEQPVPFSALVAEAVARLQERAAMQPSTGPKESKGND